jgi:hypothetical protein
MLSYAVCVCVLVGAGWCVMHAGWCVWRCLRKRPISLHHSVCVGLCASAHCAMWPVVFFQLQCCGRLCSGATFVVVPWGQSCTFLSMLPCWGVGPHEELTSKRVFTGRTLCVMPSVWWCAWRWSALACTLCMITSIALLRPSAVFARALPGALHVCCVRGCSCGAVLFRWRCIVGRASVFDSSA